MASNGPKIDFQKLFSNDLWVCSGVEIKCFESPEHFRTHLGSFPSILEQFEKIEKNRIFSIFHGFWGTKCSNGMGLSPLAA